MKKNLRSIQNNKYLTMQDNMIGQESKSCFKQHQLIKSYYLKLKVNISIQSYISKKVLLCVLNTIIKLQTFKELNVQFL